MDMSKGNNNLTKITKKFPGFKRMKGEKQGKKDIEGGKVGKGERRGIAA